MNRFTFQFLKYSLYRAFIAPVFYLTAIVFNLFCVIQYFFIHNFFGGAESTDLHLFFSSIPFISIIAVPVLCMNSVSARNEVVPVKDSVKIISEYLTLLVQLIVLSVPLTLVPLCVGFFGAVDYGQVFTGFTGIFFYFSLVSAACVLVFEIFSKSILVSVIVSFVFLGITDSIYLFSAYFINNSAVSGIFKYLSFAWHFEAFEKGLLDSRDIVFFIAVTVLFLFSSSIVKNFKTGKVFKKSDFIQTGFIYASLILLFLNGSAYYFRLDLTESQKYKTSAYTDQLLSSLAGQVHITYYRSPELQTLQSSFRDIEDFLYEYSADKKVVLSVKNPSENNSRLLLDRYSQQIQIRGENKTEYQTVYSTIVMEYEGNEKIIPFASSIYKLEYELDCNLISLVSQKERKLNIVSGNDFDFFAEYNSFYQWISSNGFTVSVINPEDEDFYKKISENGKVTLVLGQEKISQKNCADLEAYLMNGNKIFFALNPYNVNFKDDWRITEVKNNRLQEMIESYGLYFSPDMISDLSCAKITMQSDSSTTGASENIITKQLNYPFWVDLLPQSNASQGLMLFWPVSIESNTNNGFPLLYSSNLSHLVKADFNSPESIFNTNPFDLEKTGFNPEKQPQQNYPVCYYYSGVLDAFYNEKQENHSEFLVISDSIFITDLMLGYIGNSTDVFRNFDFVVESLLKLNGEVELAKLYEKSNAYPVPGFYKVSDMEEFASAKQKTIFVLLLLNPLIILSAFVIISVLRKRIYSR